jgi:ubiquinone/menaquinone biosynthesis C-methylase UbiE
MSDIYAKITSIDRAVLTNIASVLETRALDVQQKEMLETYLSDINFPDNARVLEIGCGTGPVIRRFAKHEKVCQAIGLDPSPVFLEQAKALASQDAKLTFVEGDALNVPFEIGSFDVVIFHTTLCHIPETGKALSEAKRVLKPNGQLLIFDADYSSTSLASSVNDPLKVVADAAVEIIAYHPFIVPKLPSLLTQAGFTIAKQRGFCYHGNVNPEYMLTIVDRGANALFNDEKIGTELAEGLKQEARRRVTHGVFYGNINYASFLATNTTAEYSLINN